MTYAPLPRRLATARLVLTPEVEADAPWLATLFTERGGGTVSTAEALERVRAMTETFGRTGIGALVLRTRDSGRPLGYAAIVVGRCTLDEPELAYELLSAAHGQGYATEAARAVLVAAHATGRPRIWSTIRPTNAPSMRVAAKLGFREHHRTSDEAGEIVWHLHEPGAALP